ncbi:DNA repair helicase XPB [Euzebya tangerina]|uniref:DNA repair helicase XPB n=1 Tax=Euzebya tangerina TaxID=591198 RepID=UPI000E31D3F2|nr:DNA repair helicase XPB [Euzebya tangerina]
MADPQGPLIVQADMTVLLETASPKAGDARGELARFAELVTAPEHVHTYRITPLSLWNAAAAGLTAEQATAVLRDLAKFDPPPAVLAEVADQMSRYGAVRLVRDFDSGGLALTTTDPGLLEQLVADPELAQWVGDRLDGNRFAVRIADRGDLKRRLVALGWPPADEAGYADGAALDIDLTCTPRGYQGDAVSAWWADGSAAGGNGVLVLPCGAGKTVIGLAAMVQAGTRTLVVATSVSAARQWIAEALDKTDLSPDDIGEYSGHHKDTKPVTVATYQILTWKQPGVAEGADEELSHPHLSLLDREPWGLIIYDEVHLLPAPVFRATAKMQAIRRLGLTATLVREDEREEDVFSLIGPKRYDAPWKELEAQGWIAPATCTEVRVGLGEDLRMRYAEAPTRSRYRLSATAPSKLKAVDRIMDRHRGDRVLVIGQYLDQLNQVAHHLGAPVITGQTSQLAREERFAAFRDGELDVLVVSKIANFSIDLPEANVAIQLSGAFGSRQEEAQRLGRIIRPKADGGQAHFYTVVARETIDATFATKRQRFLTEQGYTYRITDLALL